MRFYSIIVAASSLLDAITALPVSTPNEVASIAESLHSSQTSLPLVWLEKTGKFAGLPYRNTSLE